MKKKILSIYLLLIIPCMTWAFEPKNLLENSDYLVDDKGSLKIHEVIKKEMRPFGRGAAGFKPSLLKRYWFKIYLPSERPSKTFLAVTAAILDEVNLYIPENGKFVKLINGEIAPWQDKEIKYIYPVFKINENVKGPVYLEVWSAGAISFQVKLHDRDSFEKAKLLDFVFDGCFLAIISVLMLYNLFIFFASKDTKYAYYCFYMLTTLPLQFSISGFYNYAFEPTGLWERQFTTMWVLLHSVASALMTRKFLKTKENMPNADKLILFLIVMAFILMLSYFDTGIGGFHNIAVSKLGLYITAFVVFLFSISLRCFYIGIRSNWEVHRIAKFFFPAFSCYLGGVLIHALVSYGYINHSFFTTHGLRFGYIGEALLISLALADIINSLRKADKKKSEELLDLNENLEKKVSERTEQLNHTLNETNALLNNMKQSVFSIDKEGIIIPPVSQYSHEIFGENLDGKSLYDTLFKDLDKEGEDLVQFQFKTSLSIGEDHFQYEVFGSSESFPSKIMMIGKNGDERSIRVAYSPIISEKNIVEKLMLVVEDITDIENLERESKEKEAASAIKIQKLQEIVSNDKKDLRLFSRESNLNLALAERSVEECNLEGLFRAVHTIKGSARLYGMNGLSGTIHTLESNIAKLINYPPEKESLKSQMEDVLKKMRVLVVEYLDLAKEIFGNDVDETYLATDSSLMEVSKDLFVSVVDRIKEIADGNKDNELSDLVKKLETEEFKTTLTQLNKTVNRIATSLRKDITLKIEGDDVYLNAKKSSVIKDCIMHIIQNSCDHGIEREGSITINLKNDSEELKINIMDDGRGMDPDFICGKAIEKGMVTKEESQNYDKKKKLQFIMMSGFSTKEVATEFSGRGVGMDVVKTNINDLGGSVELNSAPGEGTKFEIKIPFDQLKSN
ncbi:ATP-binding protein [Bacteriovoracales bacterium]|nr:ATP-binding protein [Bacteriovoracales bacterium]